MPTIIPTTGHHAARRFGDSWPSTLTTFSAFVGSVLAAQVLPMLRYAGVNIRWVSVALNALRV